MMKKGLCVALLLFLMLGLRAQDIHFSQFFNAPLYTNPAQSGFIPASYRFAFNNKNQWNSISRPYTTFTASAEMPVIVREYHQQIIGAGLLLVRDQAGDSRYGTTQANLSVSFIQGLNRKNDHFLSVALQAGIAQRSIDYSFLEFDSQFDGFKYDPNLGNQETFARGNFFFGDISASLFWRKGFNHGNYIEAGISVFHLNKPRQSLFDDQAILLDTRWAGFAQYRFKAVDKIVILPAVQYMDQGTYYELLFGGRVKYLHSTKPYNRLAPSAGLLVRTRDALVIYAGLDYLDYSFGISYDVNLSNLKQASQARGGFEISLLYNLYRPDKRKPSEISCPVF